jgi:hypothetical protein
MMNRLVDQDVVVRQLDEDRRAGSLCGERGGGEPGEEQAHGHKSGWYASTRCGAR